MKEWRLRLKFKKPLNIALISRLWKFKYLPKNWLKLIPNYNKRPTETLTGHSAERNLNGISRKANDLHFPNSTSFGGRGVIPRIGNVRATYSDRAVKLEVRRWSQLSTMPQLNGTSKCLLLDAVGLGVILESAGCADRRRPYTECLYFSGGVVPLLS